MDEVDEAEASADEVDEVVKPAPEDRDNDSNEVEVRMSSLLTMKSMPMLRPMESLLQLVEAMKQ